MNIKKKIALAAIPAVMALSATDVNSKVLLMSLYRGWWKYDTRKNIFPYLAFSNEKFIYWFQIRMSYDRFN